MLRDLVENKKRMRRKVPNRTSRVENHMLSTRDALQKVLWKIGKYFEQSETKAAKHQNLSGVM